MKSRHLGVGIVLAFLMAACGSSKQAGDAPKSFEGINYPDWVLKGGGAFGGDSGRVFYGVGSVSGVKDFSLARLTADNRARADIARVFETYSASLMKDYMSATTTGGESNEEQHIENVVKTFSAQT